MKLLKRRYKGLSAAELQEKCRSIFFSDYVSNNGDIKTTDGKFVYFREYIFDHAFSKEKNGIRQFVYSRARKIDWIRPVIEESTEDVTVLKKDITQKEPGKKKQYQRLYYIPEKKYLVVLEWNGASKKDLKFITHYTIDERWMLAKIKETFGLP